ncbi:hypothetical protein [Raoultella ornithinolytica]|uniref:hypothetical protein n=1 Tax=Raoultella ornithinolytica TaxID=54291 RepID=UPI001156F590|nr:hypothetical protein [Raoultella ornithinolytica]
MNIETVNELIRSLESAGELSIREQKFLKLAKAYQELAAENVGLKKFIQTDCFVGHIEPETFHEEEVTRYVSADGYEPETPATDAYLAGIKADGVEEFAEKLRIPGDDPFMDAVADGVAGAADSYAKQLREGADK